MIKMRVVPIALAAIALACNFSQALPPSQTASPSTQAASTTESPTHTQPASAWEIPEHPIVVRQVDEVGEFFDRRTGERFVPRGVNYVFVPAKAGGYTLTLLAVKLYDPTQTRGDFKALADRGYNAVRVFLDQCNKGPGCIGDDDNVGLNPGYLDNIADMMAAAHEAGIYILFTSNDLPDQGGYAEEANSASGDDFAGYRNSYYLTEPAVTATRRYWSDLLTGLVERQAPFDAVLGWELLNEQWMFKDQPPLSLTQGTVETTTGSYDMSDPQQKRRMVSEGLVYYIGQMREEILSHDPTALVTMGFFVPDIAAPDWFVDTAPLLADADLDFFDFHAYPGGASLAEHAEHFGMEGYDAKPIIMGEYGAFRHIYGDITGASRALTDWVADSCAVGFDGWLYWTYYPANASAGDQTWGFTDENGALLDLLAPNNHPNPCTPIDVPSANLAYGKPVTASAFLPDQKPEMAVDENEGTQWNAGAHAPQWIEIDLQGTFRITEIRLLVAQYPAGATVHRIQVRTANSTVYTAVHEFSGATNEGDWLVFTLTAPLENVRTIRVETVSSPSWVAWKEIRVSGEETGP